MFSGIIEKLKETRTNPKLLSGKPRFKFGGHFLERPIIGYRFIITSSKTSGGGLTTNLVTHLLKDEVTEVIFKTFSGSIYRLSTIRVLAVDSKVVMF